MNCNSEICWEINGDKFKKQALQFLVAFCTHTKENSPLQSYFARCLRCVSPVYMVESSNEACLLFERLLMKLVSYKRVVPSLADKAKSEYSNFLLSIVGENREQFLSFKMESERLDSFLWNFLGGNVHFENLKKIFNILLILSHGQGHVEQGSSINNNYKMIICWSSHNVLEFPYFQPHQDSFLSKNCSPGRTHMTFVHEHSSNHQDLQFNRLGKV